jgi:hypothetical protein
VYNRLFTKILDSSIWLEPCTTRIVWVTLIAAMNEEGYAHFSAVENLAARARVSIKDTQKALDCFLSPDPNSSNPENEGRRIERVPGGFFILNAPEHRKIFNKEVLLEQTRLRVAKYRAKKAGNAVTQPLPLPNVTLESEYESENENASEKIYEAYPRKVGRPKAIAAIKKALGKITAELLLQKTNAFAHAQNGADLQFVPYPATWFNQERFNDDPATWKPGDGKPPVIPDKREKIDVPITRL